MKIYQIAMRNGDTRKIEALGYKRGATVLVFMLKDGKTLTIPCDETILIEELDGTVQPEAGLDDHPRRPDLPGHDRSSLT